ncbi:cochaperone Pam16 [Pyronema domesticum]|nr:cochaperone Pam16 [Pyronema domesticum]
MNGEVEPRILTSLRSKYRQAITEAFEATKKATGSSSSGSFDSFSSTASYEASGAKARAKQRALGNLDFASKNAMTLSEACQILNVKPLQDGKTDMEIVMNRFKRLYDVNDPEAGGSFYLQSKVLRARERIEAEVRKKEEEEEREEELQGGWRPRLFNR